MANRKGKEGNIKKRNKRKGEKFMVKGKKTWKRKKRTRKKDMKKRKKNIYGKTKEHAKRLAHTSHVPHIFNLTLCGFSKVSRLGVLPLTLSQTKFVNLAQNKGPIYNIMYKLFH